MKKYLNHYIESVEKNKYKIFDENKELVKEFEGDCDDVEWEIQKIEAKGNEKSEQLLISLSETSIEKLTEALYYFHTLDHKKTKEESRAEKLVFLARRRKIDGKPY